MKSWLSILGLVIAGFSYADVDTQMARLAIQAAEDQNCENLKDSEKAYSTCLVLKNFITGKPCEDSHCKDVLVGYEYAEKIRQYRKTKKESPQDLDPQSSDWVLLGKYLGLNYPIFDQKRKSQLLEKEIQTVGKKLSYWENFQNHPEKKEKAFRLVQLIYPEVSRLSPDDGLTYWIENMLYLTLTLETNKRALVTKSITEQKTILYHREVATEDFPDFEGLKFPILVSPNGQIVALLGVSIGKGVGAYKGLAFGLDFTAEKPKTIAWPKEDTPAEFEEEFQIQKSLDGKKGILPLDYVFKFIDQTDQKQILSVMKYAPLNLSQFYKVLKTYDSWEGRSIEEIKVLIAIQIAEAVREIHLKEIHHRDLKTENVLVSMDKVPLAEVIDFGLSVDIPKDKSKGSPKVLKGGPAGTPFFISPEYRKTLDPYALSNDLWGLGMLFYELWHGPVDSFSGDRLSYSILSLNSTDQLKAIFRTRKNKIPMFSEAVQPGSFLSVVWDLLQPDPLKRISIDQVIQRLTALTVSLESDSRSLIK